ncbi:MAG: pyridoxal phosphate-dependent aminotransferase [Pyramidobacter sp.]|nr:pyridoxal phosphate-dependent aminotransferase [Pyramidobacter sp.]MBQ4490988.1 pyridoxal phosphate-dependent aminotransferase [Pyramidobacter sp.]
MNVSERISNVFASPIRKLSPYAAAAKAAGKKVYHLNIGQPDIQTPPAFLEAIRAFDDSVIAYGDSRGDARLLDAIQKYYHDWGMDFDINEITITAGGSEALLIAMMGVCDPGDEILVFEPFYANYLSFANVLGVNMKAVTTKAEKGYELPGEAAVEACITPRTKAILITNPGNPTGRVLTSDEMELVARVVKRHDLALIVDEVYREFVYGFPFRSFGVMPGLEDNLIVVDSLSKRYSACGARIGALLSHNAAFNEQIMKYCQARLCCPELEQIGAAALYSTPRQYLADVNDEYRRRRDTLEKALSKLPGVTFSSPQGAFYTMIKMPVDSAEKFAIWMLEQFDSHGETVMFAPGDGFYLTPGLGTDEARLAYVLNCADLERAIAIIGEGLKAYPGAKIIA